MDSETELLPLDAKDLFEEISLRRQREVNGDFSSEVVQFYPALPRTSIRQNLSIPSADTFCESDYLRSNPDVAAAVQQGQFRSGFEHWINGGEAEGRRFEPCEFSEADYLKINPDVISAIQSGSFASGFDHWVQCGRLEGRATKKAERLFTSSVTKLNSKFKSVVSQVGSVPPTPQTLRGRVGRWFIQGMRRLLWWYTCPLRSLADLAGEQFSELTVLIEQLAREQEQHSRKIQSLQETTSGSQQQLNSIISQRLPERIERLSNLLLDFQTSLKGMEGRTDFELQNLQRRWEEDLLDLVKRLNDLEKQLAQSVNNFETQQTASKIVELGHRQSDLEHRFAQSVESLETELGAEKIARQTLHQALEAIRERGSFEVSRLENELRQLARQARELGNPTPETSRLLEKLNDFEQQEALTVHLKEEILHLGDLGKNLEDADARLLAGLSAEMGAREALAGKLEELNREYDLLRTHYVAMQRYAEQTRADVTFHNARVQMFLKETRRRLPRPLQSDELKYFSQASRHEMDALYVAFEAAFRGTREEVKKRQSIYLSHLAAAQAGTPERPVLDLGCGRGEWLDLLRDHQLTGKGVDHNLVMLGICRDLGLDVLEADALQFTSGLPDSTLGAVTAFHIIEHLPFDLLAALLGQAMRVLKPGGLLILETPNPANLTVSSQSFYLDPTHLKPLPSAMLRFFVEARGFANTKILTLHPDPAATVPVIAPGDVASQRLNELFNGPRDYAIIAERP